MKRVNNYSEFNKEISGVENVFLLLYKNSSDSCDCAMKNFESVEDYDESKNLMIKADVYEVGEIHKEFDIDTVPALLQFKNGVYVNVFKGCMTSDFYDSVVKGIYSSSGNTKEGVQQKRVVVYSTRSCPWCVKLKDYLKENNIRFEDVDVSDNQSRAEEMRRKSGQMGVPQTDIGGQMIVGFDKMKINSLLGIS
jgi:glutaredoxin-like YruB-family protein